MSILALYHMKGGVGKTATAVNLAYLASLEGSPTLLCDLDPQGSASYYFRIRPGKQQRARKILRAGKKVTDFLKGTDYPHLEALPAHISYRNLDITLDGLKRSKQRLQEILCPLTKQYRYIFLDSPPNITLVSENIFQASDMILVPVIPTTLSVLALDKLLEFFKNKGLERRKILAFFSMVEKRKKMHREMIEEKRGDKRFLNAKIPYSAVVEKMGVYREPVGKFNPSSQANLAYQELWEEIKSNKRIK